MRLETMLGLLLSKEVVLDGKLFSHTLVELDVSKLLEAASILLFAARGKSTDRDNGATLLDSVLALLHLLEPGNLGTRSRGNFLTNLLWNILAMV